MNFKDTMKLQQILSPECLLFCDICPSLVQFPTSTWQLMPASKFSSRGSDTPKVHVCRQNTKAHKKNQKQNRRNNFSAIIPTHLIFVDFKQFRSRMQCRSNSKLSIPNQGVQTRRCWEQCVILSCGVFCNGMINVCTTRDSVSLFSFLSALFQAELAYPSNSLH